MTWIVDIVDAKDPNKKPKCYGTTTEVGCKHLGACQLPKISDSIGQLLTSVDTGSDGHMASGHAILYCDGYEAREPASEPADDGGSVDGTDEAAPPK